MTTKGGHTTCGCGAQVKVVRYQDGKKVCQRCSPVKRSGTFLRRMEGETREYHRDILQVVDKEGALNADFVELYGKEKADKAIKDHSKRRNA